MDPYDYGYEENRQRICHLKWAQFNFGEPQVTSFRDTGCGISAVVLQRYCSGNCLRWLGWDWPTREQARGINEPERRERGEDVHAQ
jgi:hypothetical protein